MGFFDLAERAADLSKQRHLLLNSLKDTVDASQFRVLVVEDELAIQQCCREILAELGYQVDTAGEGETARRLIGSNEYDVALLDLVLPGAMGFDLLKLIKARSPSTVVIVITGHANYENAVSAIRGGAADFLSKPFTLDELQIAVAAALERRKLALRALVAEAEKEAATIHFFLTMRTLITTLEARDAYTRHHSEKVAAYSMLIAQQLALSEEEQRELYVGACLHDIGKVGVRDAVLLKPGKLTPEEFRLIQQHPAIGREILRPSNFPESVVEAVLHHHERLNGSGYPDGISGSQWVQSARIVATADVFDVMTSKRQYREAHPPELAME